MSLFTFRRFAGKGWSAFRSLSVQVKIGVLSVATLSCAVSAKAHEGVTGMEVYSQEENIQALENDSLEAEDLNEVTVAGSLAPLTQLQSARIVSVLSREEIDRSGAQSVNDLLKLATGVDVRQRGGWGIQTDISIDGGTYEQVTILLNGVNISNPHTGHLAADFPVNAIDIERIEILEGASSRVYGGQAFGGAINIVTRQSPGYEFSAQGGMHGTAIGEGRIEFLSPSNGTKLRNSVSGGGGRSSGGTLNDAWSKGNLYWQGAYEHKDFDLQWQAGFSRKEYGANTFYSGSSNDQWEQNERYLVSVSAETKGRFHFMPQVYWNRTYDNYEWHKGTPNNSHQADVYGVKAGGWFMWRGGRTAVNAELRQEGILSSALGVPMDSVDWQWAHGADKQYTKRAERTNVSFNLEHNVLLSKWTLSFGVLANMNTRVGHGFRFYPGVDIAYRPRKEWKMYLSYNRGFRLPSFTDLYYNSPDITGNDQLKPEENNSVNLGATYRKGLVQGMARVFYNHGHNMIDYVKENWKDAAHADNFDLDVLGTQAEVKLEFGVLDKKYRDLALSAGYTWMQQWREGKYDVFTSLYAADYLKHKVVVTFSHPIWDRLTASWNLRYQHRMGAFQKYDGTTPTAELQAYEPYTTLSVKVRWADPRYEVWVNVDNITNCRYQDIGNIPQPGAWLMAGVKWKI